MDATFIVDKAHFGAGAEVRFVTGGRDCMLIHEDERGNAAIFLHGTVAGLRRFATEILKRLPAQAVAPVVEAASDISAQALNAGAVREAQP